MSKTKRILSAALAGAMLLAAFSGCGEEEKSHKVSKDKKKDKESSSVSEVLEKEEDKVTSIKFAEETINIAVGESVPLNIITEPSDAKDKTFKIKSNDDKIVKVTEEGKLKGIAAGSTTVTATLKSDPTINATLEVTVIDEDEDYDDLDANPFGDEGADGTIKLKVWAPDSAYEIMRQHCDEFIENNKMWATIEIDVVSMGEDDAASRILLDAKSGADVFGFGCDNLDRLVAARALTELSDYDANIVKEINSEASVLSATNDGKLYAFPETGDNSYCLVYDKRVVSDEQAKTLEGTLKACKDAGKKFIMDAGNGYYACTFMFTGGLTIEGYEDDGITQKFSMTSPDDKSVKTALAFHKLFTEYKDTLLNTGTYKIAENFISGTAGAGIDGAWDFKADYDALGDNAGFAVLPTIDVDGTATPIINFFGYKLIGVNAESNYPSASLELAHWLTGEKCQKDRADQLDWGPSNKNVAASSSVKNNPALSAIIAQQNNSVPQICISPLFWGPMGTFGSKVADASNPIDEAAMKSLIEVTMANIRDE